MIDYLELYGLRLSKFVHGHCELDFWLCVVTLELAEDLNFSVFSLRDSLRERLLVGCAFRENDRLGRQARHLERLEKSVAVTICVYTCDLHLLAVCGKRQFESVGATELGDRDLKFLHKKLHDFVDALMDDEVGDFVDRRLL